MILTRCDHNHHDTKTIRNITHIHLHNNYKIKIIPPLPFHQYSLINFSQKPHIEVARIEIVETLEYCDQVKPQLHRIFTKTLRVPAVEPNIDNCSVMKIAYEIGVKAKASGMHRSVWLRIPVLIGTVPLKDEGSVRRFSYSSFETEI
jgi:hypothetical protein